MELRNIRSVILLAENGSMTRTASELHVSPPAVYKQIKALEEEVGAKVYEHAGGRLQLTPAGQALLPHFQRLMGSYNTALDSVASFKGDWQPVVRIGGGLTISTHLLPALLRTYRRRHTDVDLAVEAGNAPALLDSLYRGTVDLAFLASDATLGRARSRLSIEATWKYEFVVVANRRVPRRRCSLADLQDQPFILYGKGFRPIEQYFSEMKVSPRVIMRFDHSGAIRAMVEAGLGMSMLPLWTVDQAIRRGDLSLIELIERPLFSNIVLVRRKSAYVPAAVQEFIDLAKECGFNRARLIRTPPSRSHAERFSALTPGKL